MEPAILPGHVPSAVAIATAVRRLPSDQQLKLAIGLPLRDRPGLAQLLQQIYDPASTNYQRYLSPQEFTARFGPSEQDYQAVIDFARQNGLRITAFHPNRTLVDVSGSVGDIEKAWHINLHEYRHPYEARTFYAPDVEPTSPAATHILHISGLNNFLVPRPAGLRTRPVGSSPAPVPLAGGGPAGSYRGSDFRGAYVRGISLNGAGQMVGLLEFDGFYPADIASYLSQSSLPTIPIITVTMDGYDGTPGPNNVEVALDIEVVSSIAPGLSAIVMYEAGPGGLPDDILNRMATDNVARQLSASWTFPISPSTEQIFLQFAAQGQSYFNASGDAGAYSGVVTTPADDPNVTVVGGTTLTTTGPGGAWVSETVWSGGSGSSFAATGGGISTVYPIPDWQKPVDMTLNHGSTTMRNLPDVAAIGDNVWVTYNNGSSETVGGTSCSAPFWAGFTALANQQAAGFGQPSVGFLNPTLYRLGLSAGYTTNFHDVTVGNNTSSSSPNEFHAVAGYDLCTGWGSPIGPNLLNALAPRSPSPLLTNLSATIVAEGCSPGNGAIDPSETVGVSFSVKNLGAAKTTNLVATLVSDDGVLWPSAPQSYGVLNGSGSSSSRVFSFTANGKCGDTLPIQLHFQDGVTDLGTLVFSFPLGKPLNVLTQNFDAINPPSLPADWSSTASTNGVSVWIASTAAHDTGLHAAFADEPPVQGFEELISPPVSILTSNAQLVFKNNFNTEADPTDATVAYDGGVLEIQIGTNDFTDILLAGGSFVSGGYTRTITTGTNSDNPLSGHKVWGGNSGGFITSVVNLPANAAGQTVVLKWKFAIDTGNFYGGFGWYIDSVTVRDGGSCCNPLADLAVIESVAPEPVDPGQPLVYSIAVTNQGPGSAFGVVVSNELTAGVQFSTGSPGCLFTNGMVLCDAGTLAGQTSTNFSYEVLPVTSDPITNLSSVFAYTPDPNTADNAFALVSSVNTNAPPVVYLQPTNTVSTAGASAVLQANAFGAAPLAYQWFFEENLLSGETGSSLVLTNLQPEQSGRYSVVVTNVNGATTSTVAQIIVAQPATLQVTTGPGSNWSVTLSSVTGLSYTLEYKDSLLDAEWTPILPPMSGTGSPLTLADTNAFEVPARFYRVSAR